MGGSNINEKIENCRNISDNSNIKQTILNSELSELFVCLTMGMSIFTFDAGKGRETNPRQKTLCQFIMIEISSLNI